MLVHCIGTYANTVHNKTLYEMFMAVSPLSHFFRLQMLNLWLSWFLVSQGVSMHNLTSPIKH